MKSKIPYVISMTVLAVAAIFLFIGGYLAFTPVKVIEAQRQPYKILTPTIKAGGTVVYEVDACKFKDIQSMVIRRFVDEKGLRYPLAPEQNNVKPGCGKTQIPLIVPETLHPGVWHITLDVSYRVNLFRDESYHLVTDNFTIEK